MPDTEPQRWTVEVRGWLTQDVADRFAAALAKNVPLPSITVRVVQDDGRQR